MTTGHRLTEPPHTPFPDVIGSADAESLAPSRSTESLECAPAAVVPETTTADDINVLLTTSIEKPEPDPMLGSADPLDLDIGVRFTPSPDAAARGRADASSGDSLDRYMGDAHRSPYSWPTLLLASYSSAVTLALIWVLLTHRGYQKPEAAVPPPPAIDWGPSEAKTPVVLPKPSEERTTTLGAPLVLGELEVTPIAVEFRDVDLFRIVDLEGSERRTVSDCLVLTLRLTNRSSDRRLTPIELATVRNAGESADGAFIETAAGERVAMFELAMESEWSIADQSFPSVRPGRSEDVILVSEPVSHRRLAGPLVWRVTLQTDAGESEEIGVRFDRHEIEDPNR